MDADRRRWLQRLAEACERVLADHVPDSADAHYLAVRRDVERLLADLRAELDRTDR